MLGPMMMHLVRQRRARLDEDLLDLESGTFEQDGERSPGTVVDQMVGRLDAVADLEGAYQASHSIAGPAVGDQNRVRGLDHDQVGYPHAGDQPSVRSHQAPLAILQENVPLGEVAVRVLFADLP